METKKNGGGWLEEAAGKARKRELEVLKASKPDLGLVNRQEQIANQKGFTLVKIKDVNRAEFTQIITDNVECLMERKYLTKPEQAFIFAVSHTIELHSNALVRHKVTEDGLISTGEFLSVSEIAEMIDATRQTASSIINSLIKKGILYELADVEQVKMYGRIMSERALFANPEVLFCGDRNKINATLCRMVIGADRIEKAGIHLPWKVWLKEGAEYGRLYKRNTYLRLKSGNDVND